MSTPGPMLSGRRRIGDLTREQIGGSNLSQSKRSIIGPGVFRANTQRHTGESNVASSKTNEQILTDWLAALRNPENKQTTNELRDENTGARCCLGVLVDESGIPGKWDHIDTARKYATIVYGFVPEDPGDINAFLFASSQVGRGYVSNGDVPEALVRTVTSGKVEPSFLVGLNDGDEDETDYEKASFAQIADYIEATIAEDADKQQAVFAAIREGNS